MKHARPPPSDRDATPTSPLIVVGSVSFPALRIPRTSVLPQHFTVVSVIVAQLSASPAAMLSALPAGSTLNGIEVKEEFNSPV